MKKNISFFSTSLYAVGLIFLFGLTACNKSSPGRTATDNTFSFSYNGTKYTLAPLNYEYSVDSMNIQISRLDIFGAIIVYQKPDCAYYSTDNTVVYASGNCQLTYGS